MENLTTYILYVYILLVTEKCKMHSKKSKIEMNKSMKNENKFITEENRKENKYLIISFDIWNDCCQCFDF
jgi:hypothetical protein